MNTQNITTDTKFYPRERINHYTEQLETSIADTFGDLIHEWREECIQHLHKLKQTDAEAMLLAKYQQHTGKIISISIPFWDLDLIEEMDLQARMECCSSRSHYLRRLIRRGKAERIKAERQHEEWVQTWGQK